jgi:hypothetical protein
MQSRLRATVLLSTFSAVALLAGCPDPEGQFSAFNSRIPDGKPANTIDAPPLAEIPDITGTFLLAIYTTATQTMIQTRVTIAMTKNGNGTATANFHIEYLDKTARTPVGTPFDVNGIAISNAGEFTATLGTIVVPVDADPLGLGPTAENVSLPSHIESKDAFCGSVEGNVTKPTPINLHGSTFGAVRVMAGQTGGQLPAAVTGCTVSSAPDAGP